MAVEKYKVEDEVLRMYKDGINATKMSRIFNEKGIKISPLSINKWLKEQRIEDTSNSKLRSKEKFELMVTDYKREITSILDEVKDMKAYAKEKKELEIYVKLVGKLFQGLELLARLMGDIKPTGSTDIKIIINEMNKKIFEDNKELRGSLHTKPAIDVEAQIVQDDQIMEQKISGEKK